MRRYRDVEIEIRRSSLDNACEVSVSAAGFARTPTVVLPVRANGRRWTWARLTLAADELNQRRFDLSRQFELEDLLGRLLLPGDAADHIVELLAAGGLFDGVRLCLTVDDPDLANLPWEASVIRGRPGDAAALLSDPRVSLIRRIGIPPGGAAPIEARSREGPVRFVVAVGPEPPQHRGPHVDVIDGDLVRAALDRRVRFIAATVLGHCSLAGLAAELSQPTDVVIFAGHGERSGGLWMVDDDGRPTVVPIGAIVEEVAPAGVQCFVANACWTSHREGHRASLADALCRAGVPAAVGMSFQAESASAALFVGAMAAAFTAPGGATVDEAVSAGREAAHRAAVDPAAFAMPVLSTSVRGPIDLGERSGLPELRAHRRSRPLRPDHGAGPFADDPDLFVDDQRSVLGLVRRFLEGSERVLMIIGTPGSGKSTMLRAIDEAAGHRPGIPAPAASLLRDRRLAEIDLLSADRLVVELAAAVLPLVKDWPSRVHGVGAEPIERLESLVLRPLRELAAPALPLLVLVDALDEDQARVDNFLPFLRELIEASPSWVRVICTARPDAPWVHRSVEVVNLDRCAADRDLATYAERLLGLNRLEVDPAAIRELAERAGGSFLFVREAIRSTCQRGGDRLVLDDLPAQLSELHRQDLCIRFPRTQVRHRAVKVLAMAAAGRGSGLTSRQIASIMGLDPAEVDHLLDRGRGYWAPDDGGRVQLFHPLFADFVSGTRTDEADAHRAIVRAMSDPRLFEPSDPYRVDHAITHACICNDLAGDADWTPGARADARADLERLATDVELLGELFSRSGTGRLLDILDDAAASLARGGSGFKGDR